MKKLPLRLVGWLRAGLRWITLAAALPLLADAPETAIPLAGRWRFALDRGDVGRQERWEQRALTGTFRLPGSLPQRGIGDPITVATSWTGGIVDRSWFESPEFAPYRVAGQVKVPFWLQPTSYYAGVAWFQRQITIPEDWRGRRVVLFLERCHWETRAWVDGEERGVEVSLGTPHQHVLGPLSPGQHRLTLRVDNRRIVDVGQDSHSISDHTQGNWNGIVGRLELRSTPAVWIDDLQTFPRIADAAVIVRGQLGNASGLAGRGRLRLTVHPLGTSRRSRAATEIEREVDVAWSPQGGAFEVMVPLGADARRWDEFEPARYELLAELREPQHRVGTRFGLVEFGTRGTQFTVNGRPTYLRGTLECSIFPRTGHPPVELAEWRRILGVLKAHGLNHLRFHSHCPPEAAFEAADEAGVYLHIEASSWANASTTLGDGKPVDQFVYDETERILRHYGNHPSFVLMPYGNEPGGPRHAAFLARWVNHFRERDPRRLWTSGAGWPQLPENQWHSSPDPRIQGWGQGLQSRINAAPPETTTDYRAYIGARSVPVVSHEIGQWCVYPNFREMTKYTGYLKPRNFEIFRDRLEAQGMLDQAPAFLFASGKLQALCYKEEIESALRTPGMGGFQLLDLHDFPGQGTALVGVLDPFWEEKGYIRPAEFARFCGPVVPLARLSRRVFETSDSFTANLELANYGADEVCGVVPQWSLRGANGRRVGGGELPVAHVAPGTLAALGEVHLPLAGFTAPAHYEFVLRVGARENSWDVWVYPPAAEVATEVPAAVRQVRELDEATEKFLNAGGTVWLALDPRRVRPDPVRGPVALGFSSIFWNTAWTRGQAPHTLGILCDPHHPLLAAFPTEGFSNWQWWYLEHQAAAMILDGLPKTLRPEVQVIDDWFSARKLGLVFEARVGAGRLLVTSIDLNTDLEHDAVRRQFRASAVRYLQSRPFRPPAQVTPAMIRGLYTPASSP